MELSAIFSKTGKGVQEASGKTSHLSRADRAVLSAIDGKSALSRIQEKFEKLAGPKFEALIQQLDKDGYIREVGHAAAPAPSAPAARPAAPAKPAAPAAGGDDWDFTQIAPAPKAPAAPQPPTIDLAAAGRAEAERRAKEQEAIDYKSRAEAEAKAKAAAEDKARAEAEARARAAGEAKAKAEAEARARAEAEKTRAEAEAKVKAAREAAVRMAAEAKAKAEAEAKAKADAADKEREAALLREREAVERARKESEDKARLQAELNAKLDEERKAREDAERRAKEATELARKEAEEKARRDAEALRQRLEAEMREKLEAERKAREEEDRKRREEDDRRRAEEDRRRKEADEKRQKAEEERRAKEEAERKARDEADRKRREEDDRRRAEEDRRRKEEDEKRQKAEEERRAKDEARRAKEEAERKARDEARAKEDAERAAREAAREKEAAERRAKEDAERRRKEEAEAKDRAEQSASAGAAAAAAAAAAAQAATIPPPPAPAPAAAPATGSSFGDSLLADLDHFGQREEEEQKAKEEAERKAKEEAARKANEEAERRAKDEAERKRQEEEARKRREEEERRAREDAEREAREEAERQAKEDEERKRQAKEPQSAREAALPGAERAAAPAAQASRPAAADDDIGVTEDDLDMDDIKRDQKAISAEARRKQKEREAEQALVAAPVKRPRNWGKPAAIGLFVALIAGVGVLHVMPINTREYQAAASEAFGAPVRIDSARLSVLTGVEVRFEGVSIGDNVRIRQLRGFPEIGSLFGPKKAFSRIEAEGLSLSQGQLGEAVLSKMSGDNFRVGRIVVKQATLEGPLKLPALDVEAIAAADGALQSLTLRGPDKLTVQLSPRGKDVGFEITAASFAVPFVPALSLADFSMKGTATQAGATSEFDGRAYDGVVSGTSRIRWGASWTVDGEVRVRGVKAGVFAPGLVSEGKLEGRGAYTMSGAAPAGLHESARLQGEFKIEKGVLGSFDLNRALQTGGAQTGGRTVFNELNGQGTYDKGVTQLRNVSISGGAMNATASLDIDPAGGLNGRIAAEVKAANQVLRANLSVAGKMQDPVIRK